MHGYITRRRPWTGKRRGPYIYDLNCATCNKKASVKLTDKELEEATNSPYSAAVYKARHTLKWALHRVYGWRCPKHKGPFKW